MCGLWWARCLLDMESQVWPSWRGASTSWAEGRMIRAVEWSTFTFITQRRTDGGAGQPSRTAYLGFQHVSCFCHEQPWLMRAAGSKGLKHHGKMWTGMTRTTQARTEGVSAAQVGHTIAEVRELNFIQLSTCTKFHNSLLDWVLGVSLLCLSLSNWR